MPTVFDRKQGKQVEVEVGMGVKFIDSGKPITDAMLREQVDTKFTVKGTSYSHYHERHLIHFTDHTHTSHPETMEVWYDDLHGKKN
jgi:hypothetical protein